MRRKATEAGEEHPGVCVDPEPEALNEAGRRSAELLRRILEVDPLACPRCGEEAASESETVGPRCLDLDTQRLQGESIQGTCGLGLRDEVPRERLCPPGEPNEAMGH
jgi:hypothetical protein